MVVRRRRSARTREAQLERALALVREAESREPDAIGGAPSACSRASCGAATTAWRVLRGDLAWSEPEPAPSELAALVSRVGDEVGDR